MTIKSALENLAIILAATPIVTLLAHFAFSYFYPAYGFWNAALPIAIGAIAFALLGLLVIAVALYKAVRLISQTFRAKTIGKR